MKKRLLIFLIGLAISFSSCDNLVECIIPKRPEITSTAISNALVNDYYEQRIRAEVKNEPCDTCYIYLYDVQGLPPGIFYESQGSDLFVYGTPLRQGRFTLNVNLFVSRIPEDFDGDGFLDTQETLCNESTSKVFTFEIF